MANVGALDRPTSTDVEVFLRSGPSGADAENRLSVPDWGTSEWMTLFAYATTVELEPGAVLIEQHASDRALYVTTSGKLEVAILHEGDGSVSEITKVGPGSIVGEFAFFDGRPRSAKVWAVSHSRLLRLTLRDFDRYRSEHPDKAAAFLFAVARLLAIRIRNTMVRG